MNPPERHGLTDLHSHLVPGVDDGSRTVAEALEGISRLWDAGVRNIVTTPHLDGSLTQMPWDLEVYLEEVGEAFENLRAAAGKTFPEVSILRGHEVMLDVPDPVLTDPRIRLAGTNFVLVEWPRLRVPPATTQVLGRLRGLGLRVIVAHPERYYGLDSEGNLAGAWRQMGALLQVNYGSLVGSYGDASRKRAFSFLERGWVDLFSTDFHGRPHLDLQVDQVRTAMEALGGREQFHLLARVNPTRVASGGGVLPVPPLAVKKGLREKVWDLFRGRE
ncbi:MAG: tyrosine-protein phosphatase [Longimicrobiales bacterium]